jgi:hypothetical protein
VDGSTGSPRTVRGGPTPDGFGVRDVAVGRYSVSARYAPQGKAPRPLVIRLKGTNTYAASATALFETIGVSAQNMEFYVKFP